MITTQVVLALAVFGACAVEAVEALTLVVAAGTTRGWRSAFEGTAVALIVLAVLIGAVGVPLVHYVPIDVLRVVVGGLLLVLGLSWLRKAILRSAGHVQIHDEDAIYARTVAQLSEGSATRSRRDGVGFVVAFKGVLLEGLEIVLIVISLGSSSHDLGLAAAMAGAAAVVVAAAGVVVARQLREVPENALKFGVGIMLSSFGVFWIGEGIGLSWPGSDAMILALVAGFLVFSYGLVRFMRSLPGGAAHPGREVRIGET
jgi:Ca2+/H+ antiporter, TMEM165/GDT1 family